MPKASPVASRAPRGSANTSLERRQSATMRRRPPFFFTKKISARTPSSRLKSTRCRSCSN
eukprot:4032510-Pyramimonas_sp.AAC.1